MHLEIDGKNLEVKFTPKSYSFLGDRFKLGPDPVIWEAMSEAVAVTNINGFRYDRAADLILSGLLHEDVNREWVYENILNDPGSGAIKIVNNFAEELYTVTLMVQGGISREKAAEEIKKQKEKTADVVEKLEELKKKIKTRKKPKK